MESINLSNIKKIYHMGDVNVHALKGVDLSIESGEFVAIMGASGSGKSTLMNIIGCLDIPTEGLFKLNGTVVNNMKRNRLADIRNEQIGFVFQGFNLLSRSSALENVTMPLLYNRSKNFSNHKERGIKALDMVGLKDRMKHEPNQMSGGQQQRVAIARALINEPAILLADEPTGNLDSKTSTEIMSLFQDLNDRGITIVLVTHESELALYAKRVVVLKDGTKIKDEKVDKRKSAKNDFKNISDREDEFLNGNSSGRGA